MAQESNYNPDAENEKKSKNSRKVLWVVILAMVILNGFFVFKYFKNEQKIDDTTEKLVSSEELRQQLETEVASYEKQVDDYKGEVDELDTVLAQRNKEIKEKADQIRKLIAEKKISISKYNKALEELKTLRYYTKKYQRQIDSLYKANQALVDQNVSLKQTVRERTIEADKLKDVNVHLENKVALGSRLEAKSIDVTGISIKSSGKEKETNNINKMDQIKVCFELKENIIADKEKKDILVKITDPNGETLALTGKGSGEFDYKGEKSLYTVKKTIMFDNKPANFCVYWGMGQPFEEGKYTIELFTDGYLVGGKNFELKSGFSLF